MSFRTSLCVSIVSHGQGRLIANLLGDLQQVHATELTIDEVVLTLNIPEDESFLGDFALLPIRVLRNVKPKGFGANHNAAFSVSQSDVFVVANPDIRLSGFRFTPMLESLEDPAVGLWAPRVLSSQGHIEDSARRFPTMFRFARRVLLGNRINDYSFNNHPIIVDWAAGMFVALRRETYAKLGGFDEHYFMYLEDADLCRRIGKAQLKVLVDPRVSVVHDAQRASRRSLKHMGWHMRSAIRFLFGM